MPEDAAQLASIPEARLRRSMISSFSHSAECNEPQSVFFEMSFPKGICVCNLSSPLTFVGLTRFVSAILEGELGNTKVVIVNIEADYPAIESDLPAVDAAADRLFSRGILPLLVVPEGGDQVNRHFEREARIGTFRSLKAALNSAKTFLDSNICGDSDDVSGNASP